MYQWEIKPSAFVANYAISLFALCPFIIRILIIKPIPRMVLSLLIPSSHKNFIICEQQPQKIIKENWKWTTKNQNVEGNKTVRNQSLLVEVKGQNTQRLAVIKSKKQVKNMQTKYWDANNNYVMICVNPRWQKKIKITTLCINIWTHMLTHNTEA